MGFKENLLKKIKINRIAAGVLRSMGPKGGPGESERRLDRELMRELLEMGDYTYRRERDLDLYIQDGANGPPKILVLDNELKIYRTTIEDVALRKSPTTKEMISIRNAIKILSDKAVVVSRKADTVERVRNQLLDRLDLTYTPADIESLVRDGRDALQNNYADGILETLTLFAELLGYVQAPKPFQLAHHRIWGKLEKTGAGGMLFGPLVAFNMMQSELKLFRTPISSQDKQALEAFQQKTGSGGKADLQGPQVWDALGEAVLNQGKAQKGYQ